MKRLFRFISIIFTLVSITIFSLIIYGNNCLPDSIKTSTENVTLSSIYTVNSSFSDETANISNSNSSEIRNIKLFGTIPVKSINVSKTDRSYVYVGGDLLGIRLKTQGVLIVGTESFESFNGIVSPAVEAGIAVGDILCSIDGKPVSSNEKLSEIIENCNGKTLSAELKRNDSTFTVELKPEISKLTGIYKSGMWIRDSTGGIGTLTYLDASNGIIATLGHGIYDVDTQNLMPSSEGQLVSATLNSITKGTSGKAGELKGSIGDDYYGEIITNCENGIYGHFIMVNDNNYLTPVAEIKEIKTGKAQIISTVSSEGKKYYDIEIEKIITDSENKNMIIKITDDELLEITGGIVQGMSGSPIIQNGMFVGAVTHVFLNDPTKGYGIFAENMQNTAEKLCIENQENAS